MKLKEILHHKKEGDDVLFEGFESFDIITQKEGIGNDVSIHGTRSGTGPPLLLLHGFPQTHHIWHLVAPQLTSSYTVVALDLRGYGASSKPSGVENYAKSVMARDCVILMEKLGLAGDGFFVCAHDRGARVAHKMMVDWPGKVKKAILLDICPTLAMYTRTDLEFAKAYFHWFFLIQDSPLPETLISAAPRKFLEMYIGQRYAPLSTFSPAAWEQYAKVMEDPEAVHAMCEDYRASASLDLDEARKDIAAGRLIKSPFIVLWGKYGVIEKCFDAVKEWNEVSDETVVVFGNSVDCGHYLPEEASEVVVENIREFLV